MKEVGVALCVAAMAAGAWAQTPQDSAPKVTAKPVPAQFLDEPDTSPAQTPAAQPALHGGGTISLISRTPSHQSGNNGTELQAAAVTLLSPEPAMEIAPEPAVAVPTPAPVTPAPSDLEVAAVATLPPGPVAPIIEGPFANAPLPVAMTDIVIGTCLASLRGEIVLDQSLPADAVEGIGETISGRMITRPQAGSVWTTQTLEGEMLLGGIDQRAKACQVLAVSPLGKLVMDEITEALVGLDSAFEIVDETGTDSGTPVHWRRLRSSDNEFIDILHYKGVPGGRPSTLHVIVG